MYREINDPHEAAEIARGISHELRFLILNIMRENEEIEIKDIAKLIGAPPNLIRNHLLILNQAGLVDMSKKVKNIVVKRKRDVKILVKDW